MTNKSLLLACTALTAAVAFALPASAVAQQQTFVIAQAPVPAVTEAEKKAAAEVTGKKAAAEAAAKKAAAEGAEKKAAAEKNEVPPKPGAPADVKKPAPPAVKPPVAPPAAQMPAAPTPPAAQRPAAPPPDSPPPAARRPTAPPPAAQTPASPPAAQRSASPPPPAAKAPDSPPPAAQTPAASPPAAQRSAPPPPPAAQAPAAAPTAAPTAESPTETNRRAPQTAPAAAAPPPPTQPRSANEFMRRGSEGPSRGMNDVRRDRRETRDGNRTIITEGDRTIVRDGSRTYIRHNEADRFAIGARDVRVDRRGNETVSIIVRPDGFSIITTTDNDGRLLRRVRRGPDGREVIIIDNRFSGAQRGKYFVDVRRPRYQGPRDRYILNARRADRDAMYTLFIAPPIERIDRRYTLDQVRYSEPLRDHMPRVDLDVNFETGSWQLTPDQVESLAEIAYGLNRAIEKNPREVFLIEGHTDAVGSNEDNLSLSDRRAEAVAVALTEQFRVPPENLVTQGYGEEHLAVATDGPSRENRRVAVRRITPLMAGK